MTVKVKKKKEICIKMQKSRDETSKGSWYIICLENYGRRVHIIGPTIMAIFHIFSIGMSMSMAFGYSACDITTPFHLWCNIALCERNDEMLKMLVCSFAFYFVAFPLFSLSMTFFVAGMA